MAHQEFPILTDKVEKSGLVPPNGTGGVVEEGWLREVCLEAGADDVGFVELDRKELEDQRQAILVLYPKTQSLISFVCRMNREPIRSPSRSIANLEFHKADDRTNEVARTIVRALEVRGIGALNPAMGFPMEMERFPGKIWDVSHKPVAVAAGLGKMGIHRNVIHPRFGSFILLGTIMTEAILSSVGHPLTYNPCVECKLCVSTCPVGAIRPDGSFNFSACYTHNYREFMGGFTEWVETIAESRTAGEYRKRVLNSESVSMWQSLSFGANYKAAYCLAVCPAGEDVRQPFALNRKTFTTEVVKPLQRKSENVYVLKGSDAETHVQRRFPHKRIRYVRNSLRPQSIQGFLDGLPLVFQKNRSEGVDARYHFTFLGKEERQATIEITRQTLLVSEGHRGQPDLRIVADGETWIRFLNNETGLVWSFLRGKIKIYGSLKVLRNFVRCFPI